MYALPSAKGISPSIIILSVRLPEPLSKVIPLGSEPNGVSAK